VIEYRRATRPRLQCHTRHRSSRFLDKFRAPEDTICLALARVPASISGSRYRADTKSFLPYSTILKRVHIEPRSYPPLVSGTGTSFLASSIKAHAMPFPERPLPVSSAFDLAWQLLRIQTQPLASNSRNSISPPRSSGENRLSIVDRAIAALKEEDANIRFEKM
jgi:hypothetical protein